MSENREEQDPLFSAAVLKLSFLLKDEIDQPGFRFVYFGTLREMGLKDSQVEEYIKAHRAELEEHLGQHRKSV